MRAGFPTGTRRCRSSEGGPLSSRAKSVCLSRESALPQNSDLSVEVSFELHLL
jgi:hypothetical protein